MQETRYEAFKKYIMIDPGGDIAGIMESRAGVKMIKRLKKQGFTIAFSEFEGKKPDKNLVYYVTGTAAGLEKARKEGYESVGLVQYMEDMEELMDAHADYVVLSVKELEDFLMRQTSEYDEGKVVLPGGKPGGRIGLISFAVIVGSFILFMLLRTVSDILLTSGYSFLSQFLPVEITGFLYRGNEFNNSSAFYIGNIGTIISGLGYLIASVPLVFIAKKLICRTDRDMALSHLMRTPVYKYILGAVFVMSFTLATQAAAVLVQAAAASDNYRQVLESQYSCNIFIGIIVYVIIGPLAEELLFRGIIYTTLRRYTYLIVAVIASAAAFGIYHGNIVQGIYAFIFGCIAALAYEYYGSFFAAVAVHALQNLIAYIGTYTVFQNEFILSWPFVIIMTVVFSGSLFSLIIFKDKK